MLVFTIRRLIQAIPILFGASLLTFWLMSIPADPVTVEFAGRNPRPPQGTIDAEMHRFRLDESFWAQYWDWIKGIFHGNWGPALDKNANIFHDMMRHFGVTTRLIVLALIVAIVLAVLTGVMSAIKQYSVRDYTFTFLGFVFLSMPTFWIAQLLKTIAVNFNTSTGTHFFGTLGAYSIPQPDGFWNRIVDYAGHLVLPTISLALITYAGLSRFQRASMLEVMNSDYVRLARAKGISARRVLTRHMLRTALIPMTTATALTIAVFFGGTIITETVFNWNGMGVYTIDAISSHDKYIVLATLMLTGFIVIIGNLVADILYAVLDPRIRYA
jgi:peptide/nickel transport system permease protein